MAEFRVKAFGRLAEFANDGILPVKVEGDVAALRSVLADMHPGFSSLPYRVAVNRQIVEDHHALNAGDEIAVMPPFSGG